MLLALSEPVNCIFWPIKALNLLVAASKLYKHRLTCSTVEWAYCQFVILWPDDRLNSLEWAFRISLFDQPIFLFCQNINLYLSHAGIILYSLEFSYLYFKKFPTRGLLTEGGICSICDSKNSIREDRYLWCYVKCNVNGHKPHSQALPVYITNPNYDNYFAFFIKKTRISKNKQ